MRSAKGVELFIIKKIISALVWIIPFSLIMSVSLIFIFKVIPCLEREIVKNALVAFFAAFFGAFFTFSLVEYGKYVERIRKHRGKHINSLVKIERILNRTIETIDKNIQFYKNYYKALKAGNIITWTRDRIPHDDSLLDDLLNIDFVNDYFIFLVDIKRINQDFETLENMYEEAKEYHYVHKVIDRKTYDYNISEFLRKIEHRRNFLEKLYEDTIQLLAKSRVLLKERERKTFLFGIQVSKEYKENFNELVKKESIKLNEEIEEQKRISQEEINLLKRKISESKEQ